mgnify:CR=1 FL=1
MSELLDKLREKYKEEGWRRLEGLPLEAYILELFLERRPILFPATVVEKYSIFVVDFPMAMSIATKRHVENMLETTWDIVRELGLWSSNHYMSSVRLIVLSNSVEDEVRRLAERYRKIKGIRLGLHGLVRQYLVVLDLSQSMVYTHKDLKKQKGFFEELLSEQTPH